MHQKALPAMEESSVVSTCIDGDVVQTTFAGVRKEEAGGSGYESAWANHSP